MMTATQTQTVAPPPPPLPPPSDADDTTLEFPVTGMTCASCVTHVEHALQGVDGVTRASVNLALATARVERDPARAPMNALVQAVEQAGYGVPQDAPVAAGTPPANALTRADQATQEELQKLRRDLAMAAVLTVPLLVLAMGHGLWSVGNPWWDAWLQAALATPVVLGPGARFFRLAWASVLRKRADMNTLVALGTGAAFVSSFVALVSFPANTNGHLQHAAMPELYFEAAAAIITFVLLGKVLETTARRRLADAVKGLMSLQPVQAHVWDPTTGEEHDLAAASLVAGQVVRVRSGERIPADGRVESGASELDESMLTGESMPVLRSAGDNVVAGATNGRGTLLVRVTGTGRNTVLGGIIRAVEEAQGNKAPMAALADRVAAVFVPVVLGIAVVTFVVWALLDPTAQGLGVAMQRFVAVLVMACPCALGLATPAAVAAGTGRAAQLGVLFKGGAAMERLAAVDTVLLDKTGTLTTGKPVLGAVMTVPGHTREEVLTLLAAAESPSEHPVARALVDAAQEQGMHLLPATEFEALPGRGVTARVDNRLVQAGTLTWLQSLDVDTTVLEEPARQMAFSGATPVAVAVDGRAVGVLAVADVASPGAAPAVAALTQQGLELHMVTGDRAEVATTVAQALGISKVHAQVTPEGKATVVKEARAAGATVAMVGDGLNDAPALAAADVGVAMGGGTHVAASTADVVLLSGGIQALPRAVALARATVRTMRTNLFWAFAYNVAGIPVAAGLLYPFTGWQLSPMLASAAMSLSSVSVLANALRLRRLAPR